MTTKTRKSVHNKKADQKIFKNDGFVDITDNVIIKTAKSNGRSTNNSVGDGKIFIQPLEECIRIRTEER